MSDSEMTKYKNKEEVIMYTCQGVFDGEYGNVTFSKERESHDDHKCIILVDAVKNESVSKGVKEMKSNNQILRDKYSLIVEENKSLKDQLAQSKKDLEEAEKIMDFYANVVSEILMKVRELKK